MLPSRPVVQPVNVERNELPSLEYTLHKRKWSILIFWSLVLIDSIAMPISLYFGLTAGTSLSSNVVFSIVTAALGGVSIAEYVWRFWKLFKTGSSCRCLDAKRFHFDWFHWTFSFVWVIIIAELVVGTSFTNPPIRLLAMPLASILFTYGTLILAVELLRGFSVPLPFRMSSQPSGSIPRPAIYPIIEDITAVDGGGGREYRERLSERYEASIDFRRMLGLLSVCWGVGTEAAAVVTTVLVFTLEGQVAYTVGWSLPFVLIVPAVLGTVWHVRRQLKKEKERWTQSWSPCV